MQSPLMHMLPDEIGVKRAVCKRCHCTGASAPVAIPSAKREKQGEIQEKTFGDCEPARALVRNDAVYKTAR